MLNSNLLKALNILENLEKVLLASQDQVNQFLMKFGHFYLENIKNDFSEHFLTLAHYNELEFRTPL